MDVLRLQSTPAAREISKAELSVGNKGNPLIHSRCTGDITTNELKYSRINTLKSIPAAREISAEEPAELLDAWP